MEKIEQDRHDIGKELNIEIVLNHLEKTGQKKNSMFECHII